MVVGWSLNFASTFLTEIQDLFPGKLLSEWARSSVIVIAADLTACADCSCGGRRTNATRAKAIAAVGARRSRSRLEAMERPVSWRLVGACALGGYAAYCAHRVRRALQQYAAVNAVEPGGPGGFFGNIVALTAPHARGFCKSNFR